METLKATGRRGDWFATINGEEVPCAWSWWLNGMHYFDPGARLGSGKWVKYVAVIERSKKVALAGKKETKNGKWERDGYIGLFNVANVRTSATTLEFDLVQRIADLK